MMYKCPNEECESTTFIQIVKQFETVHVNEDGDPLHFDKNAGADILEVFCGDCETEVNIDERHRSS